MKILVRIALTLPLAAILAGGAAFAESLVTGKGQIQARNLGTGVVYIGGHKFNVGPQTKLHWSKGGAVALKDLELPTELNAPGLWRVYVARYQAVESPSGPVLTEVTLIEHGE
jgi:hypothetical protein